MDNGNYYIIPKSQVTTETTILPVVWKMKRKWDTRTREIKKWKDRLNIYGSRMKMGINYKQKFAPVASWNSI